MKLIIRLGGSLLIYGLISTLLVLLVLMPREISSQREGAIDVLSYHFSWSAYQENISAYLKGVQENKTLGMTIYNDPVEKELLYYGARSIKILIPAFIISLFLGIWKGVYDYRHERGAGRLAGRGSTWLLQSLPDFFFIMIIQMFLFFCMRNGIWKPDIYGDEEWYNILLPIIYLAMYPVSLIARFTAEALEEEEGADYIRTARSKGASERTVIWKHALKNCWPKLLGHFMPIALTILSAMFVVEYLSMYRGIGTRLIRALQFTGFVKTEQPMEIDTAAIIGFSLLLMGVLLILHWIHQILTYFLSPKGKEGRA